MEHKKDERISLGKSFGNLYSSQPSLMKITRWMWVAKIPATIKTPILKKKTEVTFSGLLVTTERVSKPQ